MIVIKSMFVGAAILVGVTVGANAQGQYVAPQRLTPPQLAANPYQTFQPAPDTWAPTTPPSWSYNPYTSGEVVSPNRSNGS